MSYHKLNYEALQEEFCVEYYRTYGKLPHNSTTLSKPNLIKMLSVLKKRKSK